MNILVIDDDEASRLLLSRILSKKLSCEVYEAKNGLEGLSILDKLSPDLVILDVLMPLMDGNEVLELIRSDSVHAAMPVVIMSALSDKVKIFNIMKLGVADYLLKPLQSDAVQKRLSNVIAKIQTHRQAKAKHGSAFGAMDSGKPRLLLVDNDINFRTFFFTLFDGRFEIIDSETSAEGLQLFINHQPTIVCVSEKLRFMSEHKLAEKIRSMDKDNKVNIFLFSSHNDSGSPESEIFNGVVKKSFVPDVFLKEFARVVLGEENLFDTVLELIQSQLRPEVVTAIQQTVGVLTMQEIELVENANAASVAHEVLASVHLIEKSGKLDVALYLLGAQKDVLSIAQKILGSPCGLKEGAADAFGEILSIIGGRVCSSIEKRGVKVQQGPPFVATDIDVHENYDWRLNLTFRTDGGEQFVVGIDIS